MSTTDAELKTNAAAIENLNRHIDHRNILSNLRDQLSAKDQFCVIWPRINNDQLHVHFAKKRGIIYDFIPGAIIKINNGDIDIRYKKITKRKETNEIKTVKTINECMLFLLHHRLKCFRQ